MDEKNIIINRFFRFLKENEIYHVFLREMRFGIPSAQLQAVKTMCKKRNCDFVKEYLRSTPPSAFIMGAFLWDTTMEGGEFWCNVNNCWANIAWETRRMV